MGVMRAAIAGSLAGAVGTLAMDLLWYRRFRSGGGEQAFVDWETAAGTTDYEHASAPAKTAQLASQKLLHKDLPDSTARAATNGMHWAMGTGWGKAYGLAAHVLPDTWRPVQAVAFGPTVFAFSYLALGAAGIYQPIWTYSRGVLWQDFSAHLTYGLTTAAVYQVLEQ